MKHFAIGDIHGNFLTMQALLKKLPIGKDDKVIFLGDYIDRGPRSFEVLQYIMSNPQYIYLMGNHEEMFYLYIENHHMYEEIWARNGGKSTLDSLARNNKSKTLKGYHNFISGGLSLCYQSANFIFAHGGINGTVKDSQMDDFLWTRGGTNNENKTLIIGHTPMSLSGIMKQDKESKIINIDNGCFLKERVGYGHLIAYCPEEHLFWEQRNID